MVFLVCLIDHSWKKEPFKHNATLPGQFREIPGRSTFAMATAQG